MTLSDDEDDPGDDALGTEVRERLVATLRHVVGLLVARDYAAIEALTRADWVEDGIDEYGHELVAPPDEAYTDLDVVPVEEASPRAYSVRFRLYTKEEGRSDLELRLTLTDLSDAPLMAVELDDLRVA